MPLYDFLCPKCGLQFEVSRQRSAAGDPAFCPQDGTESARVFTAPVAFVKGNASATPPPSTLPPAGHDHGHSHGPGGHVH